MSKRILSTAVASAAIFTLGAGGAAHAAPTIATLDGPSADVKLAGGVDVATDATGALVYTKAVGGVDHVFASRLSGGTWSAPERVDTGSADAATSPRVATYPGGGIVVTWLAGAATPFKIKSATAPATGQPFGAPVDVIPTAVAKSQDLDVAPDGTGYVTFTEGFNVRAARLAGGTWTPIGGPVADPSGILDQTAGDEAGGTASQQEPDVAAYNGGAVLVWPETDGTMTGHVWARRLTGLTAGAPSDLSVPTFGGHARASSADMPDIAVAADGTAHVAFRELFTYGGTDRPNVLMRRLPADGSAPEAPQQIDGLPADPTEGAETPGLAISPNGQHGLVGTPRQLTFQTFGSRLSGSTWSTGSRLDAGTPTAASFPVAAVGDNGFGTIAFYDKQAATDAIQASSGTGAPGTAADTLSSAADGPIAFNDNHTVNAAAATDGTSQVVFAQGAAATRRIVVATIPTTVVPGTPGGPGAPGTPGTPPAGTPARTSFGRTVLITLPTMIARRPGRRLAVRLRNREPFTVKMTVAIRTIKRKGHPARTLGSTTATFKAGQSRTVNPKLRVSLRRGARVTLRLTLRAPTGKARIVSRTVKVG
jgi:hypothetical protein